MKCVQVITGLDPGGAERIVLQLTQALAARGDEAHVVCLLPFPPNRALLDELLPVASSVTSLEVGKHLPWRIHRLRDVLDRISPDLVHSHLYHPNLAARLALRDRATPLVNTVHNSDPRLSKAWLFLLDRLSRRRCDLYTAVSRAAADFHAARIGLPPDRIRVIPNGVVPPDPLDAGEIRTLRQTWGVEGCRVVFGTVGRLHPQKGFKRLLRALPEYAAQMPPGSRDAMVILGDGPEMPDLRELAAAVPANLSVVLPGFWQDADRATGAFDVFVMPSRYEGFGLAVADAMGHGIPVVISSDRSLQETTAGYATVLTADFDRPGDVSRAMATAAAAAGVRHPRPVMTVNEMTARYLACYDDVIARKTVSPGSA